MNDNKLVIATAGSGKTRLIINEALDIKNSNVLITTYTEANKYEIVKKIISKNKCVPSNITVQTWFSFLLEHGVRPYQSVLNEKLVEKRIGFCLIDGASGTYVGSDEKTYTYGEDKHFFKHYFTEDLKIYSDKISKFVYKCNDKTKQEVINRLTKIYPNIFIDEVQDLAGWDLEIIKLLLTNAQTKLLLVGDPRQVAYLTHHPRKHTPYMYGEIKKFILEKCKQSNCVFDETTLSNSHRNNKEICEYSSRLFPEMCPSKPCSCKECRSYVGKHKGIYLVRREDVKDYKKEFKPVVLKERMALSPDWNYGKAKGLTFERVMIYPTKAIEEWIMNNQHTLANSTRCKFYVALTRARYSVAIVLDYEEHVEIPGVQVFK